MFYKQSLAGNLPRILATFILAIALPGCAIFQGQQKCESNDCDADAQITAAVKDSFVKHPDLGPPGALRVETIHHVVYLYGIVATDLQRNFAGSLALQASNNAQIVNSISVDTK